MLFNFNINSPYNHPLISLTKIKNLKSNNFRTFKYMYLFVKVEA